MKILYHGARSEFKIPDLKRIRENATSEGVGFYCTDNFEIAKTYGMGGVVIEYIFRGIKGISSTKRSVSLEEWKKFVIELDSRDEFLSNFGDVEWEGYESVLNKAMKSICTDEPDIEILSGICNAIGDISFGLDVFKEVLGYDHCIVSSPWGEQNIYLILDANAIEFKKSYDICSHN